MNKSLISISLTMLLGACSLTPDLPTPDASIPGTWRQADSTSLEDTKGLSAANTGWATVFAKDPDLLELISRAIDNNRSLRVALLNIEVTRAMYGIQKSDSLPSINASASATRQQASTDFQQGPNRISSAYVATIGFSSFELDFWGRVRNLNEQALRNYLASEDAAQTAQITLISEVANTYVTLVTVKSLLNLAEQTLKAQQASYALLEEQFKYGQLNQLTLSQARTQVELARSDVASLQAQFNQTINGLQLIVGTDISDLVATLPNSPDLLNIIVDVPYGLPSDLMTQRPDIRRAEHLLIGANANIGAARANYFPRIALTSTFGSSSRELSDLFSNGRGTWAFSPSVSLPIFNSGAISAGVDASIANRDIALANYEQSIQVAFREVSDVLALKDTLNERLDAQKNLVAAAQRSYDLSNQRHQVGIDSYINVLDSQRVLYSAEQSLIQTQSIALSNRINLYKVLGGGWDKTDVTRDCEGACE